MVLVIATLLFLKYIHLENDAVTTPKVVRTGWYRTNNVTETVTEANASISAVITVEATGNFSERICQFIIRFSDVRRRTWQSRGTGEWKDRVHSEPVQLLWGVRDDYLNVLAAKYPHVTTVILPWVSTGKRVWNSLTDTVNLPQQKYYEWTADDTLCTWIETPGIIKMKYDIVFDRTCVRNISATASPRNLPPLSLNVKALSPDLSLIHI